jgi:hypothetical protein
MVASDDWVETAVETQASPRVTGALHMDEAPVSGEETEIDGNRLST